MKISKLQADMISTNYIQNVYIDKKLSNTLNIAQLSGFTSGVNGIIEIMN